MISFNWISSLIVIGICLMIYQFSFWLTYWWVRHSLDQQLIRLPGGFFPALHRRLMRTLQCTFSPWVAQVLPPAELYSIWRPDHIKNQIRDNLSAYLPEHLDTLILKFWPSAWSAMPMVLKKSAFLRAQNSLDRVIDDALERISTDVNGFIDMNEITQNSLQRNPQIVIDMLDWLDQHILKDWKQRTFVVFLILIVVFIVFSVISSHANIFALIIIPALSSALGLLWHRQWARKTFLRDIFVRSNSPAQLAVSLGKLMTTMMNFSSFSKWLLMNPNSRIRLRNLLQNSAKDLISYGSLSWLMRLEKNSQKSIALRSDIIETSLDAAFLPLTDERFCTIQNERLCVWLTDHLRKSEKTSVFSLSFGFEKQLFLYVFVLNLTIGIIAAIFYGL